MKIYIDFKNQVITKTSNENVMLGDIYSNVFELLFYNFGTDTNWFPTLSQLAPNGRSAGDFSADALGIGETHDYTEDGVNYLKYDFTIGDGYVNMSGRSMFYIWVNRTTPVMSRKGIAKVNVNIDASTDTPFITDPLFNPKVKNYIDSEIDAIEAQLGDGSPKYFDTAANILAQTEDKGLAVATDTGAVYYWDDSTEAYVASGLVYNQLSNYYTKTESDTTFAPKSTAITHTGNQLQDYSGNDIYPILDPNLMNDISIIEEQSKYVDGVYYPDFEKGSIINGVDDDSAYYLLKNARTVGYMDWETTKTVVRESGITFYIIGYDEDKSYIGTSAGQNSDYSLAVNIFSPVPTYFRLVIRNSDSSDLTDTYHKIKITNSKNLLSDVNTLLSDVNTLKPNVDNLLNNQPPFYEDGVEISSNGIVSKNKSFAQKRKYIGKKIIAINHDDLPQQDYLNTRKIYNHFGFNANFNFILKPFADEDTKNSMISNVRKMVADGNDIGLHAVMGKSYWWMNKLFDIRPNYSFSFAPNLSDCATDTGNGKNVFGYAINASKKWSDIGFKNVPSTYADIAVQSTNGTQYITLISYYCLYHNPENITGLDLTGVSRTWKASYWLEYWYNNLIDNTLGYSSSTFFGDYDYPSGDNIGNYYPDIAHLKNGKMVFYDDTTNPNYNNPDYQKVGRFNSGLFKGCASCCNYEVEDRIIQIAKAFMLHYFGIDNLTNFGRHGIGYVDCLWYDGTTPYDNRDKTIISGEVGIIYSLLDKNIKNQHDILLKNGIKMTNHYTPLEAIYESQIGLYYGQDGIRYPFFNHTGRIYGQITYLNMFDTSSTYSGTPISYSDCMALIDGLSDDEILKQAYDNSGQQVTRNSVTKYVTIYLKTLIDVVRSAEDTGKIPVLSLDTIVNDASTNLAIKYFLKWCYDNDYYLVPLEYARAKAISKYEYKTNYFPNPTFKQNLIAKYGNFSSADAYMPDGWAKFTSAYYGSTPSYDVSLIDGNKVFTIKAKNDGYTYIFTRMYGLKSGTYTISYKAKVSDANKGNILIFTRKNSDTISISFADMGTATKPTTEWATYTKTITISDPYVVDDDGTVANQYSKGYENNIVYLEFMAGLSISGSNDSTYNYELSIKDVKVTLS